MGDINVTMKRLTFALEQVGNFMYSNPFTVYKTMKLIRSVREVFPKVRVGAHSYCFWAAARKIHFNSNL